MFWLPGVGIGWDSRDTGSTRRRRERRVKRRELHRAVAEVQGEGGSGESRIAQDPGDFDSFELTDGAEIHGERGCLCQGYSCDVEGEGAGTECAVERAAGALEVDGARGLLGG